MKQTRLSANEAGRLLGVDTPTLDRLRLYLDQLHRWQERINLVSVNSLVDAWRRHIVDSAQLRPLLPAGRCRIADAGSGAGFPGLVLAILDPAAEVVLIEADGRKCAFLAEAARVTETRIQILNQRIERVARDPEWLPADAVTARALAPLARLIGLLRPIMAADGRLLLLKGAAFADELTAAERQWKMRVITQPSVTAADGVVARIDRIEASDDT